MRVTVLLPCQDESRSVRDCVASARHSLESLGIAGEVLVVDNASRDGSADLARAAGARVVVEPVRGYGAALRAGIRESRTPCIVFLDSDGSYDLDALPQFLVNIEAGADVVVGNRFAGKIAPGAMPTLHRRLGTPLLSAVARVLFGVAIRDINCGIRALNSDSILGLDLRSSGMEFASELVAVAAVSGLTITEVPVNLHRDSRGGRPGHLRPWRDGVRHLVVLIRVRLGRRADPAALGLHRSAQEPGAESQETKATQ